MNKYSCGNCQKEVVDQSRLIKGKCFHCTYLEQLQKTKKVIQQHNVRIGYRNTSPSSHQRISPQTDSRHSFSKFPLQSQRITQNNINNSLIASRGKYLQTKQETKIDRVGQTVQCIRCFKTVKITDLIRGVCDNCMMNTPYRGQSQWTSNKKYQTKNNYTAQSYKQQQMRHPYKQKTGPSNFAFQQKHLKYESPGRVKNKNSYLLQERYESGYQYDRLRIGPYNRNQKSSVYINNGRPQYQRRAYRYDAAYYRRSPSRDQQYFKR